MLGRWCSEMDVRTARWMRPCPAGRHPDRTRIRPRACSWIVAENFAFDLAEFSVPADTPFQIEFDHRDVKIPHNVAIYDSGAEGPALFRGEIFDRARVVTYDVPGLPRGVH